MKLFNIQLLSCVIVLLYCCKHFCRTEEWNRADEQIKAKYKSSSTKQLVYQTLEDSKFSQPEEEKFVEESDYLPNFGSSDLSREHTKQSVSEDVAKSARVSIDNLVKDMRSKAISKAYESTFETRDPIEQSSDSREGEHEGEHLDGNIRIAVQSKRRYEFVPVHFDRDDIKMPKMIEIVSDTMPLRLHFKSQSAAIVVTQSHMSRK